MSKSLTVEDIKRAISNRLDNLVKYREAIRKKGLVYTDYDYRIDELEYLLDYITSKHSNSQKENKNKKD